MRTTVRSTDKAKFTRKLPLELKQRWALGDYFKLPLTYDKPNGGKSMYISTVATTAMYDTLVEYRYANPITKVYAHGLIDITVFLDKATK